MSKMRASGSRITPACAGKRSLFSLFFLSTKDHPRMRGEKLLWCSQVTVIQGSPPHARGKDEPPNAPVKDLRITPACAGTRGLLLRQGSSCRDHPRMRGEKACKLKVSVRDRGSPPHARGKVCCITFRAHCYRITPACAGKSRFFALRLLAS